MAWSLRLFVTLAGGSVQTFVSSRRRMRRDTDMLHEEARPSLALMVTSSLSPLRSHELLHENILKQGLNAWRQDPARGM